MYTTPLARLFKTVGLVLPIGSDGGKAPAVPKADEPDSMEIDLDDKPGSAVSTQEAEDYLLGQLVHLQAAGLRGSTLDLQAHGGVVNPGMDSYGPTGVPANDFDVPARVTVSSSIRPASLG